MEIALGLRKLWGLRLWVVGAAVVAVLGSVALTQKVSLAPPSLQTNQGIEFGAATSSLLVDSAEPAVGDLNKPLDPLIARASLVALLIRSEAVQTRISKAIGVPKGTVATTVSIPNPMNPNQPPNLSAGAQASGLITQGAGYQILASPEPEVPIVDIYTQAPDGSKAVALAQATTAAVSNYLGVIQKKGAVPKLSRVKLSDLGSASGGNVNSGAGLSVTVLAFLAIFIFGCLLILAVSRIVEDLKRNRDSEVLASMEPPHDRVDPLEAEAAGREDHQSVPPPVESSLSESAYDLGTRHPHN
jgi:hypothetical protein